MRGNEADGIARQTAVQQKKQIEAAKVAGIQQMNARLQSSAQDIEQETQVILRLLAQQRYPGVK